MRRLAWALAAAIAGGVLFTWIAGSTLIAVNQYPLAAPDATLRTVTLATSNGQPVEGWLLPGASKGALLLLHGIRADRTQMLARSRFLQAAGYTVLLIDLPGHGASPAPAITFGLREGVAVKAALDYLRRDDPRRRVGIIGVSLGAASYVLCADCPPADAVILESMYPTIEDAVLDRLHMRVGVLAPALSPLLLAQLPLRLDIDPAQLRPIARMPALGAPVLIVSGDADLHTTIAETRRIFDAAKSEKALWEVPGAAHVDLHRFAPAEYERRVLDFLGRHL